MMSIPYLVFEVGGNRYLIDAYFTKVVEKEERLAVLIRPYDMSLYSKEPSGRALKPLLGMDELAKRLKEAFIASYEHSGEKFDERLRHMRRWNIWRFLGIPTGHQRHIEKDEELAEESREAMMALTIFRKVLGVKKVEELDRVSIRPMEYVYYDVLLKGDDVFDRYGKKDRIYTQLMMFDESFKREFLRKWESGENRTGKQK